MKKLPLLLFFAILLLGCSKDDSSNNTPIQSDYTKMMEYLQKEGRFNSLMELVRLSGMEEELKQGNVTFLAPNDEAFRNYFNRSAKSDLTNLSSAEMRKLLTMLMIEKRRELAKLQNTYLETRRPAQLGSRNVNIFVSNTQNELKEAKLKVMDANVLKADVQFGTISVNEIDQVLEPPRIADFIRVDERLGLMYDLFIHEYMSQNYMDMMYEMQPMTVFLATDKGAISAMKLAGYDDYYSMPPGEAEKAVRDNILMKGMYLDEIKESQNFEALSGRINNVRPIGKNYLLEYGGKLNVEISEMDIQADNGVMNIFSDVKLKVF